MARQVLVLALILFFIVGMASAAAKPVDHDDIGEVADGPSDDVGEAAEGPSDDIGTSDANDDAAPVGGPVPAGAFPESSSESQSAGSPAGSSSFASALEVSTIAGIAATAAGAAFFF